MIDFLIQISAIGFLEFFGTLVLLSAALLTIIILIGAGLDRRPYVTALILLGIPVLFALRRIIIGLIQ